MYYPRQAEEGLWGATIRGVTGRIPLPFKVQQGLPYLDVCPVRDDEWDRLSHTWLCSDTEWDPSIYDHEVDHDWEKGAQDSVEKKFSKLSHDANGVLDVEVETLATEEDTSVESVSAREVQINLTRLVEDELVDSVLEYEVDNDYYHCYPDSDDESLTWGEYKINKLRRSRRLAKAKRYFEPKEKKRGNKTVSASIPTESDSAPSKDDTSKTESIDKDESTAPRTDYNNRAKDTSQNEPRTAGPYRGKPSKRHYSDYARHFGGVPEKVIRRLSRIPPSLDGHRP